MHPARARKQLVAPNAPPGFRRRSLSSDGDPNATNLFANASAGSGGGGGGGGVPIIGSRPRAASEEIRHSDADKHLVKTEAPPGMAPAMAPGTVGGWRVSNAA